MGEGSKRSGADFLGRRILVEDEFKVDHQALEKENGEMKCRLLQPRTWGKWERKAELM